MAQPATLAATLNTVELDVARWSPRTRTMVILTTAVAAWAVPAGLIYGVSRIFL